jgi:hypothetical protein
LGSPLLLNTFRPTLPPTCENHRRLSPVMGSALVRMERTPPDGAPMYVAAAALP